MKRYQPESATTKIFGYDPHLFNYYTPEELIHHSRLYQQEEYTLKEARVYLEQLNKRRQYLAQNRRELQQLNQEKYEQEVRKYFSPKTNALLHWCAIYSMNARLLLKAIPKSLNRSKRNLYIDPLPNFGHVSGRRNSHRLIKE